MADKTITALTATTSAAASDEIPIWVAGSAVTRKITKANFLGGAMTGGGTLATGGYTLTVPESMTAAGRNVANTYTQTQTIQLASTGANGVVVDMPTSTSGNGVLVLYNGGSAIGLTATASNRRVTLAPFDNGAGLGTIVAIDRNNNASTAAAGLLLMYNRGGTAYRVHVDASGNLRIGTTDPTSANDTANTVVGTQTSMAAAKHLFDDVTPIGEVLANIQQAATAAVRRFTYRSGAFNGEEFEGIVTDLAPRYGMDRDEEHPAGKSLNEITLLGDLLRAVAHLSERVAALER